MSREERAKQFMPFSPLKGYGDILREKEKTLCEKKELSEDEALSLSKTVSSLKKGEIIKVVYYSIDGYVTETGALSGVNEAYKTLSVIKKQISFSDIYSVERLTDK